jgi:hypothetical protein
MNDGSNGREVLLPEFETTALKLLPITATVDNETFVCLVSVQSTVGESASTRADDVDGVDGEVRRKPK